MKTVMVFGKEMPEVKPGDIVYIPEYNTLNVAWKAEVVSIDPDGRLVVKPPGENKWYDDHRRYPMYFLTFNEAKIEVIKHLSACLNYAAKAEEK